VEKLRSDKEVQRGKKKVGIQPSKLGIFLDSNFRREGGRQVFGRKKKKPFKSESYSCPWEQVSNNGKRNSR